MFNKVGLPSRFWLKSVYFVLLPAKGSKELYCDGHIFVFTGTLFCILVLIFGHFYDMYECTAQFLLVMCPLDLVSLLYSFAAPRSQPFLAWLM